MNTSSARERVHPFFPKKCACLRCELGLPCKAILELLECVSHGRIAVAALFFPCVTDDKTL